MEIEGYFEFLEQDDIRLKGTRIGIETILYEYIYREQTPESIVNLYPTLTLEQIYATILYYLHNRDKLDAYMTDWLEYGHSMRAAQDLNPPPFLIRLRTLKTKHQKALTSQ